MTKEEYEKALYSFCDNCKYGYDCKIMKKYNGCVQMNTLNQLIKEHFELVDKLNEMERTINSLDYELNDIYHSQPYKFEELKRGMPYYHDGLEKFCLLVSKRNKDTIVLSICTEEGSSIVYVDFEEGRFLPPTKALKYQGKEDKND